MAQLATTHAAAISTAHLCKSFDDLKAVDDVSFTVRRGELFSLLGPNGAGKSTTISMLACLLRPESGDATVMGHSIRTAPQAVKACIGVVPQELALYEDLSARENLEFWGKMYGLRGAALKQRVDHTLSLIGLADRQKDRVGKFSGGMKRRVNLGIALLHTPDVIIMDEPTVGIDPQSRRHILDGIKDLRQQGVTILYTTHYMEEAQELSDTIAIMDRGRIIACGSHEELVTIVGEKDRIELELNHPAPQLLTLWRTLDGIDGVVAENGIVTAVVTDSNRILPHLFETANGHGVRIGSVTIEEPNLETVFLHLTGRALRD